ncbi:SRPBCC family protein [Lacinutrix venerupis]|uniref:Polyketide cyclase/dehydrase/lipid transport protein n=1 Tax=Lacinutrix venerupis TaxID=1486034 RepID=A0AAC9PX80_9FLAO|nr:SRPBCC family protein [Lacinutrix venerupis]APY00610.1 hypothetical protein BWR22_09905 [Lacinutrix venerupis]
MKYTSQIIIKVPLEQFITILENHDNFKHWQRGLESFEHLSGDIGVVGSKIKLNYSLGNRKMELVETITETNLPHLLHLHYDTKGVHNIQQNYFESTAQGHTKWIIKNEFLATNFFMRSMMLLSPNIFKKQTIKYLNDFKNFAEKGISVKNA